VRLARLRWLALAVLLLLPACVLPSSWDARTNGGRYDPGPDDPFHAGQRGVEDRRSGSQNSLSVSFGGE
jgi:hypothetical protein